MPIFEYVCGRCSVQFERICKRTVADEASDCPACGGWGIRRVSTFQVRRASAAAAARVDDAATAKAERLALPTDKHPPQVNLDNRPAIPQRYMHHMLEHGGC